MKKENNSVLVYAVIVLLIIAISFAVYSLLKLRYYGANYVRAIQSENPSDKCKTPPGYTDEAWKEHMSHHPDRYRECL